MECNTTSRLSLRMEITNKTRTLLLLAMLFFTSAIAIAQSPKFEVEQQDAIDLLKTLARSLKSEPDKIAAGKIQGRIADQLWTFDEPFARETFRWAFEAVTQRIPDTLPKEKQSSYVARQASALKDVLRQFGTHD